MECALCHNGTTKKGLVTVSLERSGTIVLIKKVPAEVCTNCGHYYLSEDMTADFLKSAMKPLAKGLSWKL